MTNAALLLAAVAAATASVAFAGQDRGRDIAASCVSCHAVDAISRGGIMSLAGRDKASIVRQVQEFRDGTRPSTIMRELARGYTDAQIEAAAAYFAAQRAR